jgi:perosamine synthetase
MIPISAVDLGAQVEASVLEVLRSGALAQGPKVAELERRFAEMTGVAHAVALSNGTTALVAALQLLGLRPGDEVLTSPFTFVATLNAILAAGGTARFADITAEDFCLDPASVRERAGERTAVLMPVHLYGQVADMGALVPCARDLGVPLVEDAAQAHGAAFDGRHAGSFGVGCFSFHATKNLTTGEGGMVTTDDAALADRLRLLRNHGMRERYVYELAGHNYRMTDLQAAVALPQLDRYEEQLCRRRANAARLAAGLAEVPGVVVPTELAGRQHVWHQFTVLLDPEARQAVVDGLMQRGVGSAIHYPRLVHDYDCYRDRADVIVQETPVAADVARRCLSLPVHAGLRRAEVDRVVEAVAEVLSP